MAQITGIDVNTIRRGQLEQDHPDRDCQFCYIKRVKSLFLEASYPVISVDAQAQRINR